MKKNNNYLGTHSFLDFILDSTRINGIRFNYLIDHPRLLSFYIVEFIFGMIGAIFGIAFNNGGIGILVGLIAGFPISICVGLKVKKLIKKKSK